MSCQGKVLIRIKGTKDKQISDHHIELVNVVTRKLQQRRAINTNKGFILGDARFLEHLKSCDAVCTDSKDHENHCNFKSK
jgi:hypothetical protein